MSYPSNINDISSYFEHEKLEKNDVMVAIEEFQSSHIEQEQSEGVYDRLPLKRDGDIRLHKKILYSTVSKMNSIEEGNDEDNEDEDDSGKQPNVPLHSVSSNNANPNIRVNAPIPSTSSPHPQRHSRWTSRFLTHANHWRPSSYTPAIPLPLPNPQESYEQIDIEESHSEKSITASDVSSSIYQKGSAKSHHTYKEREQQSMSSWTMDLPPMSSLYDSVNSNKPDNIEGVKTISSPVTAATATKSNSGAHGNNRVFSPPFYFDTYFSENGYLKDLSEEQGGPNVASKSFAVNSGDTSSTDAKNSLSNFEDGEILYNNGNLNIDNNKFSASSVNDASSFKSTSSLSSSRSPTKSGRIKSNIVSENNVWSQSWPSSKVTSNTISHSSNSLHDPVEHSHNHRCKNNRISSRNALATNEARTDYNQPETHKVYDNHKRRTLHEINNETDDAQIESDFSEFSPRSDKKDVVLTSSHVKLNYDDENDGGYLTSNTNNQVPVHSSLQTKSSSKSHFQGKVSFSKTPSTNNLIKSEKSIKHTSNTESHSTSLDTNSFKKTFQENSVKYNDISSASFDTVDSHFSSLSSNISSLSPSQKKLKENVQKSDREENPSNFNNRLSNTMQNDATNVRASQSKLHTIRQNSVLTQEQNNPVQNKTDSIDRSTNKRISSVQFHHYESNTNTVNAMADHLKSNNRYANSGPRTSALKSDIKKTSSKTNKHGDTADRNRTTISDSLATPAPVTPVFQRRGPKKNTVLIPENYLSKMTWGPDQCEQIENFYRDYDIMDGAVTAVVLGGFFAFVCLLVVYKTKCKPMWKNRGKRLTTTPATASVAEGPIMSGGCGDGIESLNQGDTGNKGSTCMLPLDGNEHECGGEDHPCVHDCDDDCEHCVGDEDEDAFGGFECIPLQTVNCSEEDDDDIFFLDEFGNYVFPISTPTSIAGGGADASGSVFVGASTNCSCHPSEDELDDKDFNRRVSQVSGTSNAYTVKSLPGAYLYIPVLEPPINSSTAAITSFSSVKRSLSDPEIHFTIPIPFGGHPIILTVNPSSEKNGIGNIQSISNRLKRNVVVEREDGIEFANERALRTSMLLGAKFQQRSYSMQQETSPLQQPLFSYHETSTKLFSLPLKEKFGQVHQGGEESELSSSMVVPGAIFGSVKRRDQGNTSAIDIQVIQPTPNISPTESRGSSSGDEARNIEKRARHINEIENNSRVPSTITRAHSTKETKSNLIYNTPSIAVQSTVEVLSSSEQDYSYSLTEIGCSSANNKIRDGVRRKVSFSSDDAFEVDGTPSADSMPTAVDASGISHHEEVSPTSVRRRKGGSSKNSSLQTQVTIPGATNNSTTMSYLQVPGQPTVIAPAVAPQLSPEAHKAQTSSAARNRRKMRLMKTGSFCSITSDGDGDIFELTGELKQNETSVLKTSNQSLPPCLSSTPSEGKHSQNLRSIDMRKPSDPLSEYSEFLHDDCHSDISELFGHKSPNKHFSTSTRESSDSSGENDRQDQASAVYNLNLDQEDIVFVEVPYTCEYQLTERTLFQKISDSSDVVENTLPRQQNVLDRDRKTSVDVGVQSPPPILRKEEQTLAQSQKQRKPVSDARKKRKVMAIKKESFVMPDITVHNDGQAECEVEDELYESSSCSISIGSDNESSHQIITVPVTIEHPPPEMRPTEEETTNNTNEQWKYKEGQRSEPAENIVIEPSKQKDVRAPKPSSQHHHHHHHHHHNRRQGKDKYIEGRSAQEKHSKQTDNNFTEDMSMSGSFKSGPVQTDEKNFSRVITTSEAGCQQAVPSSFVSRYYASSTSLTTQGPKTIKSADCSPLLQAKHTYHRTGIKSDEPQRRAPISLGEISEPTSLTFNVEQTTEVDQSEAKLSKTNVHDTTVTSSTTGVTTTGAGVRMVLVRDIGIQVSGNSPNLNLYRRFFKKSSQQQQMPHLFSGHGTSGGSNNSRKQQVQEHNIHRNIGARGSSAPISSTVSTTGLVENQPFASSSSTNVMVETLVGNPSSTSTLSKTPNDSKKESSKNFPPEILF